MNMILNKKTIDICDRSILITGGTGSFGKSFVRTVLDHFPNVNHLIVFSLDEIKLQHLHKIIIF